MVTTLLDVYRYDSGQKQLDMTSVDLFVVIEELVHELLPVAQSSEITLKFVHGHSSNVLCDRTEIRSRTEIRRVLQNLIDNSLKFTPPGGRIKIRTEQRANFIEVVIKDTGKGIAAETQKLNGTYFKDSGRRPRVGEIMPALVWDCICAARS